jgi:hypothetical protein
MVIPEHTTAHTCEVYHLRPGVTSVPNGVEQGGPECCFVRGLQHEGCKRGPETTGVLAVRHATRRTKYLRHCVVGVLNGLGTPVMGRDLHVIMDTNP